MRWLLILGTITLLVSCRSTKKIQTAIAKKDTTEISTVNTPLAPNDSAVFISKTVQQIRATNIDFTTFTAKVDLDYRDAADKKYDLNATIRMLKDSAIWISVSAVLGIEAMRVLVTKDSVKLLNKLDKTYTARSVDYLQEITSLPLTLSILQNLIIGNPVFFDNNIVFYTLGNNTISLLNIGPWFKNLLTISATDNTIQHSKMDDVDITRSRTADLTYTDYENKRGMPFSTKRNITVAEKKKLDIKVNFKNYNFNEEVNFPFSVPKNFKRS
ncbi:MAG: DUF4292 domain-containing protein [Chitinophagaceae bacterium]